jgi:hypothetical protein
MANFVPGFCCCPRKIIYASALAVRNSFSAETAGTLKLSNKTQIYLISLTCRHPASDNGELRSLFMLLTQKINSCLSLLCRNLFLAETSGILQYPINSESLHTAHNYNTIQKSGTSAHGNWSRVGRSVT